MADTLKTREKRSLAKMVSGYTFVLIFFAIFIAYLVANGGATTWNGVMNILRHSAVVGIMAYGMIGLASAVLLSLTAIVAEVAAAVPCPKATVNFTVSPQHIVKLSLETVGSSGLTSVVNL